MIKRFVAPLLALVLLFLCLPVSAEVTEPTQQYVQAIELYKGALALQSWLNGELTDNAGKGAEWYALALIKRAPTLDFTRYEQALRERLLSGGITAPATKLKCALVLACLGSSPSLVQATLNEAIGQNDLLMAWVFGLHVLNAGYIAANHTAESVVETVLEKRNPDGGWSVTGTTSDVDVTAMTLQALAPNRDLSGVADAVDGALALLSSRQLESGGFQSYGVENAESSAQVILALTSLGVDARDAGFDGGYERILSGLSQFAAESGGFSHRIGGDVNELATSQVYLALSSVLASRGGKSSVYLPDVAPGSFKATASEGRFPFVVLCIAVPVLPASIAVLFVLRRKREPSATAPDDTPDGEPK